MESRAEHFIMKFPTVALLLSALVVSSFAFDLFGRHSKKKRNKDSNNNGTANANVTGIGTSANGPSGYKGSSSISVSGANLSPNNVSGSGNTKNSPVAPGLGATKGDDIPLLPSGIIVSSTTTGSVASGSGENVTSSDGVTPSGTGDRSGNVTSSNASASSGGANVTSVGNTDKANGNGLAGL